MGQNRFDRTVFFSPTLKEFVVQARPTLIAAGLVLAALLTPTGAAQAQDKVVFATHWKAQAAHGGFYQAVADGTYKKFGLDVTIQPGGPQVNNRPLLPAGRIDFLMTGNLLHSFDNVKNQVPTVVVAAMIKDNPEMSDAEMEASVALMKQQCIVDSGEAAAKGIGAMSAARIKDFYDQMVNAGLYKAGDVDLAQVATLQFVNKGVGRDLKAKLGGK